MLEDPDYLTTFSGKATSTTIGQLFGTPIYGTATVVGEASTTVTIRNTDVPTSVKVTKVWDDADNQDCIRPDSVVVRLLADGKPTDKTIRLRASDGWTGEFTNLPKYAAGVEVTYSVVEDSEVPGYTSQVSGSAGDGFTITNTHQPGTPSKAGEDRPERHTPAPKEKPAKYRQQAALAPTVMFGPRGGLLKLRLRRR